MAASDEGFDLLEELREELGKIVTNHTSWPSWQDMAIANMLDRILDITSMLKEVQKSLGTSWGLESSSQKASRSIKLDLSKFQGTNPEGWLFQAEEYFSFHDIEDDSRIQIADFHMAKGALNWMRGLQRNNLLSNWDKFKDNLRERFGGSTFEDKL